MSKPQLWFMNSDVLNGFYQSEVVVAATDRDDAIEVALRAYDEWISIEMRDLGFHRLIKDCYPDDEEFDAQSREKRIEFHEELKRKLHQQTRRGMIMVHSG